MPGLHFENYQLHIRDLDNAKKQSAQNYHLLQKGDRHDYDAFHRKRRRTSDRQKMKKKRSSALKVKVLVQVREQADR